MTDSTEWTDAQKERWRLVRESFDKDPDRDEVWVEREWFYRIDARLTWLESERERLYASDQANQERVMHLLDREQLLESRTTSAQETASAVVRTWVENHRTVAASSIPLGHLADLVNALTCAIEEAAR